MGFRSGSDGAIRSKTALNLESDDGVETLLAMPKVLAGAGWGVGDIEYDDDNGQIQWTFPRGTAIGVAAATRGERENPACAFIEGFGAGWVKGSLDLDVEFLESECAGVQGSTCAFSSRSLR